MAMNKIPEGFTQKFVQDKYPPKMYEGCVKALDAGLFYVEEIKDFVLKYMGVSGAEAEKVREIVIPSGGSFAQQNELKLDAEGAVKGLPLAHYVLLRKDLTGPDDATPNVFFDVVASDGRGGIAVGGKYDINKTEPTIADVCERVYGYEIYSCCGEIKEERELERDRNAINTLDLALGQKFKDITISNKKYSTVVITEINMERGALEVGLTMRGSSKRWTVEVRATAVAEQLCDAIKKASPDSAKARSEESDTFELKP